MAEQVANVLDAVFDHGRSLEGQTPGNDPDILGKAHRGKHLGTEHTGVANLGPLLQVGVVSEDLHRGFGVGVEGRLEAELLDANLLEEGFDGTDQVAQGEVVVGHEALDLMELAEMGGIHGLVTEDTVDGEVSGGLESTLLVGKLVQHLRRHGRGVRTEKILEGFLPLEVVAVADGTGSTNLVHGLDAVVVVLGEGYGLGRLLDEEGVVRITGGMRLRLEQTVEVPEGRLDPLVGGHLMEAHLQEDVAELGPNLEEGVEISATNLLTQGLEVVLLELRRLPRTGIQHLLGQVGRLLLADGGVRLAPSDLVGFERHKIDQLPPLESLDDLGIDGRFAPASIGQSLEVGLNLVGYVGQSLGGNEITTVLLGPLVFHAVAHANLAVLAHLGLQIGHRYAALTSLAQRAEDDDLLRSIGQYVLGLGRQVEVGLGQVGGRDVRVDLERLDGTDDGLVVELGLLRPRQRVVDGGIRPRG